MIMTSEVVPPNLYSVTSRNFPCIVNKTWDFPAGLFLTMNFRLGPLELQLQLQGPLS